MNADANNITGKIVFHSTGFDNPINIFTVDAGRKKIRQLTDSPAKVWNFSPAVSPDGQMIVFNSARNGSDEIYTMNIDGTEQKRLTDSKNGCYTPCFSPDGKKIAFQMANEEGWMIYLVNSDGTDIRPITRKTDDSRVHKNPVFTADGRSIIYESGSLCIVDISTGEIKSIFAQESPDYHTYKNVAVSPDGRKIAFEAGLCRSLGEDDYEWVYTIFTSNIDGSELTKISDGFITASDIKFSPDGNILAFVGAEKLKHQKHIYVMRLDDSEPMKVTKSFRKAFSPSFSPDGSRIAFVGRKRGEKRKHIFTARVDGTDAMQITDISISINSLSWVPAQC